MHSEIISYVKQIRWASLNITWSLVWVTEGIKRKKTMEEGIIGRGSEIEGREGKGLKKGVKKCYVHVMTPKK